MLGPEQEKGGKTEATYLGVRGLHFLVHLQGIMMKPHFNKNLQKSII